MNIAVDWDGIHQTKQTNVLERTKTLIELFRFQCLNTHLKWLWFSIMIRKAVLKSNFTLAQPQRFKIMYFYMKIYVGW